jgi:hypothetical protein
MVDCTQWNNLYGNLSEWTICGEIPEHQPEGIFYRYPGEKEYFVPNGYRYTCPGDKPFNVYEGKARVLTYERDKASKEGARSRQVIVPLFFAGNDIQKVWSDTENITDFISSTDNYYLYGFNIATEQGIFSQQITDSDAGTLSHVDGGGRYFAFNHYAGITYPNPTPIDPTGLGANDFRNVEAKFLHLGAPDLTYLGVAYPSGGSNQLYTFTIYNKSGGILFQRVDKECPKVNVQNETCLFRGDIKVLNKLYFNNQSDAFLEKQYYIDQLGRYSVRVLKISHVGKPSPGKVLGIYQSVLDISSPEGCTVFPKVFTAPGYDDQCPPDTLQVDCPSIRCCYDCQGTLVKSIPLKGGTNAGNTNLTGPQGNISQNNYNDLNNTINNTTNTNYLFN